MKYEDIIDLERPQLKHHMPMSLHDRAAQFAPFAALTGYDEAIIDTAKLKKEKLMPDGERSQMINEALNDLEQQIRKHPMIHVIYWHEQGKDSGYLEKEGQAKDLDPAHHLLVLKDRTMIRFEDLYDLAILSENDVNQ